MSPLAKVPDGLPFRVSLLDRVVVVDDFSPRIQRYFADVERELPILRDEIARLVEEGQTRFLFDLRSADPVSAYPIAKWGGVYGAYSRLRKRLSNVATDHLARNIKLVGSGELLSEIKIHRLDRFFDCHATLEAALDAFRKG